MKCQYRRHLSGSGRRREEASEWLGCGRHRRAAPWPDTRRTPSKPRSGKATARAISFTAGRSELAEGPMDQLDTDRSLADRGGDAFDAARSGIADGENTRPARLEQLGSTGQRPACRFELVGSEIDACLHELLAIEGHAAFEPARIRIGPRHQKQVTDGTRRGHAGVELPPSDSLEAVGALQRFELG